MNENRQQSYLKPIATPQYATMDSARPPAERECLSHACTHGRIKKVRCDQLLTKCTNCVRANVARMRTSTRKSSGVKSLYYFYLCPLSHRGLNNNLTLLYSFGRMTQSSIRSSNDQHQPWQWTNIEVEVKRLPSFDCGRTAYLVLLVRDES